MPDRRSETAGDVARDAFVVHAGPSRARRDGDPDGDHVQHEHGDPGVDEQNGGAQQAMAPQELGQLGVDLDQPLPATGRHLSS